MKARNVRRRKFNRYLERESTRPWAHHSAPPPCIMRWRNREADRELQRQDITPIHPNETRKLLKFLSERE